MRSLICLLVACVVVCPVFAREPLTVGSAVASAGAKVNGWIDVPKGER
jgi:hypothetical protein